MRGGSRPAPYTVPSFLQLLLLLLVACLLAGLLAGLLVCCYGVLDHWPDEKKNKKTDTGSWQRNHERLPVMCCVHMRSQIVKFLPGNKGI
ncbi:hypothetical protein M0802_006012 [Mischocyttarus mexicanus]|nr:hypothetical protein M0802_006012 [Mischocyttarus mexicanus]